MKVHIVCPAPAGSRKGNRVTAERWQAFLGELGHDAIIAGDWHGERCDLMLAMHATKSHAAIRRYRRAFPHAPLVVALTGTDVYRDLPRRRRTLQSLHWADRLIGLHEAILEDLPQSTHAKLRVILQSNVPVHPRPPRSRKTFNICVLGHLRHEKDPLRAVMALRRLPHLKQLRLVQAGEALAPSYALRAEAAMRRDGRYRWLGEIPRRRALRLLAASHVMVISSRMEGGANVVSEAIVHGVPVLASRIAGNVGLLGADYRGYYPVGDTGALARLLQRVAREPEFQHDLQSTIDRLAPRFRPREERDSLAALLRELSDPRPIFPRR